MISETNAASVVFPYEGGRLLSETLPVEDGALMTLSDLLKLFISHPLDTIALYFRHLVNLLTIHNPLVYELNPTPKAIPYLISGSFLTWALGVLSFLSKRSQHIKFRLKESVYIIILTLPALAILPGQIEHRFGLPFALVLYSYLCYATDWKAVLQFVRRHWIAVAIFGIGAYLCWITIIASTFSSAGLLLNQP